MSTAQRTLLVLGGLIDLLTVVYILATRGDLPADIPMQYDEDGRVTWYATRDVFWLFLTLPWIILGALFLTFARRGVSVAWAFLWINAFAFFSYDLTYDQATGDGVIGISPGGFVTVMAAFVVVLIILALGDKSRARTIKY
ncbi:MAG: hypothetical protein ACT4OX_14855 [Actinomycetota bacterium]